MNTLKPSKKLQLTNPICKIRVKIPIITPRCSRIRKVNLQMIPAEYSLSFDITQTLLLLIITMRTYLAKRPFELPISFVVCCQTPEISIVFSEVDLGLWLESGAGIQ